MPPAVASRPAAPDDLPAINSLHRRAFSPGRFARTAYRIREGTALISPYCRVAERDGRLIAAVRFTPVTVGAKSGVLLLGPLAVEPELAGQGIGRTLAAEAIDNARNQGMALVLLVGDEPYYRRLGFVRVPEGQITLQGPVDPSRLLALELRDGALADYAGVVAAEP
ncbi:MAG: GNAT family N-acetyltransferase [Hyphomicrobiaceae bacterium]